MRAIVVHQHGAPDTLSIEERPAPVAQVGEVLIDVHAIGVNFPDLLVIRGKYQVQPALPFSPGKEVAGIVAAVGPGVTSLRMGDRVLALIEHGGYVEQIAVRSELCHVIPAEMTFTTAVGAGNNYQTAHFALHERARYERGESVLVTGASGGVGQASVQLAKAVGATVLATARRADQAELARANGADHVIDVNVAHLRDALREQVRQATRGRGVDIVLDQVGGDVFDAALRALAWRGRMVVVGFAGGRIPEVRANYVLVKNITVTGLQWSDYRDREPARVARVQQEIFDLYAAGKVRPPVVGEYPLERFAEALERLEGGHVNGKLVLTTWRHG